MSSRIVITNSNFESEVLQSPIPVLLDFWAPWCGHCKAISPALDELAAKYAGRIKFVKVNADQEINIVDRYALSSVPTLILYKNGEILCKKNGAMLKEEVEDMFKNILMGKNEPDTKAGIN